MEEIIQNLKDQIAAKDQVIANQQDQINNLNKKLQVNLNDHANKIRTSSKPQNNNLNPHGQFDPFNARSKPKNSGTATEQRRPI